jgi:hypothetical protein
MTSRILSGNLPFVVGLPRILASSTMDSESVSLVRDYVNELFL